MAAKYRVAIIGTGRMGGFIEDELGPGGYWKPYSHLAAYQYIPETEVIAVANRGAERLKRYSERFGITNTYTDYRQMIEKEKPDIVSVTTPSFARAQPIIFAAEHGVKGIYAEKGLCASLAEADRIVSAVKNNYVAFNWGALRRHNAGYKHLRAAIARGDIGEPRFVSMYTYTDLIKHHPHTLDTAGMLLGDPTPEWVEGHLVEDGDFLPPNARRPNPKYDAANNRYVPAAGQEIADPMVGFYRVGYKGGAEAHFIPMSGDWEIDVRGSEGRAIAWGTDQIFKVLRFAGKGKEEQEITYRTSGDSATVNTVCDIIREIETGDRTAGNIDITMLSVEAQFGLAHSHLQGGKRVFLPVADRTLYIPGG